MDGPQRPENGSLSPGVMWESPTGEASISLFRLYFVCPGPCRWLYCMCVGGAQVSFVRPPGETVSGEGHSGQWGFTWNIRGPPPFVGGKAGAGYFSRNTGGSN